MSDLSIEVVPSRAISNSEVTAFLSCKRQYEYAHVMDIAPKDTAYPLALGTLFHAAMERYVLIRIEGHSHDIAVQGGLNVLMAALNENKPDMVMKVQMLFINYHKHHNGWPEWKLLSAEQLVEVPLNETTRAILRYDVYTEHIPTGQRLVGDWKTTSDFWSATKHSLNIQMPKYIGFMRIAGMQVDGGFIEEVRTRNLSAAKMNDPSELFKRTTYRPSRAKIESAIKQHVATSMDIQTFRALPQAERRLKSQPVLNWYGPCQYCNFTDLCVSELEGNTDHSVSIREHYTENTYGYNKQEGLL